MSSSVTTAKCEDNLFCGINVVKNPENMMDMEKKHLPVITAPKSVCNRGFYFRPSYVVCEIFKKKTPAQFYREARL